MKRTPKWLVIGSHFGTACVACWIGWLIPKEAGKAPTGDTLVINDREPSGVSPPPPSRKQPVERSSRGLDVEPRTAVPPKTSSAALGNFTGKLADLSSQYAGNELRGKQLELLAAEASALPTADLSQLAAELHLWLGDTTLLSGWSVVMPSLSQRPDFDLGNWAASLPKGELCSDALGCLARSYGELGSKLSDSSIAALKENSTPGDYSGFLRNYASKLATTDPEAAMSLLANRKGELDDETAGMVLHNLGSEDAYATASSKFLQTPDLSKDHKALSGFASGWASVSPKAAGAWVSSLESPEMRGVAAEALVGRWAETDLRGAADWLNQVDLRGMDPAIEALCLSLAKYSPDDARAWASEVSDQKRRERILSKLK